MLFQILTIIFLGGFCVLWAGEINYRRYHNKVMAIQSKTPELCEGCSCQVPMPKTNTYGINPWYIKKTDDIVGKQEEISRYQTDKI